MWLDVMNWTQRRTGSRSLRTFGLRGRARCCVCSNSRGGRVLALGGLCSDGFGRLRWRLHRGHCCTCRPDRRSGRLRHCGGLYVMRGRHRYWRRSREGLRIDMRKRCASARHRSVEIAGGQWSRWRGVNRHVSGCGLLGHCRCRSPGRLRVVRDVSRRMHRLPDLGGAYAACTGDCGDSKREQCGSAGAAHLRHESVCRKRPARGALGCGQHRHGRGMARKIDDDGLSRILRVQRLNFSDVHFLSNRVMGRAYPSGSKVKCR